METLDKLIVSEESVSNDGLNIAPGGKGKTRWYRAETSSFSSSNLNDPTFKASVPTSKFSEGEEIAVLAQTRN